MKSSRYPLFISLLFVSCLFFFSLVVGAQTETNSDAAKAGADTAGVSSGETDGKGSSLRWSSPLVIIESVLLLLIFVGGPIYSCRVQKKHRGNNGPDFPPLRGLNLPSGSVRSMLALTIIGSYINFLLFGRNAGITEDYFNNVLAAFGTLAGAVTGFYFATRSVQTLGNGNQDGNKKAGED